MDNEFGDYDAETLTKMYEREFDEYKMLLINGKSWSEVLEKRRMVTQLGSAIHNRMQRAGRNPDAHATRTTEKE